MNHPSTSASEDVSEASGDEFIGGYVNPCQTHVDRLMSKISPVPSSETTRIRIFKFVEQLVKEVRPDALVYSYGSFPLKTYLPDGDIDVGVRVPFHEVHSFFGKLKRRMIEESNKADPETPVRFVNFINAQIPILKVFVGNVLVDISANTIGALAAVCFFEEVDRKLGQGHLFKKSILLLKAWTMYEARILASQNSLLSTYGLEVLVLFVINKHHKELHTPFDVFSKFLKVYSDFDWENQCVTVTGPVLIPRANGNPAIHPKKEKSTEEDEEEDDEEEEEEEEDKESTHNNSNHSGRSSGHGGQHNKHHHGQGHGHGSHHNHHQGRSRHGGKVPLQSPPANDENDLLSSEFLSALQQKYSAFRTLRVGGGHNEPTPPTSSKTGEEVEDTEQRSPKVLFPYKNVNIMDPLDAGNNLGRSVNYSNFLRIRACLEQGFLHLQQMSRPLTVVRKTSPSPPSKAGSRGIRRRKRRGRQAESSKRVDLFPHSLRRYAQGTRPDESIPRRFSVPSLPRRWAEAIVPVATTAPATAPSLDEKNEDGSQAKEAKVDSAVEDPSTTSGSDAVKDNKASDVGDAVEESVAVVIPQEQQGDGTKVAAGSGQGVVWKEVKEEVEEEDVWSVDVETLFVTLVEAAKKPPASSYSSRGPRHRDSRSSGWSKRGDGGRQGHKSAFFNERMRLANEPKLHTSSSHSRKEAMGSSKKGTNGSVSQPLTSAEAFPLPSLSAPSSSSASSSTAAPSGNTPKNPAGGGAKKPVWSSLASKLASGPAPVSVPTRSAVSKKESNATPTPRSNNKQNTPSKKKNLDSTSSASSRSNPGSNSNNSVPSSSSSSSAASSLTSSSTSQSKVPSKPTSIWAKKHQERAQEKQSGPADSSAPSKPPTSTSSNSTPPSSGSKGQEPSNPWKSVNPSGSSDSWKQVVGGRLVTSAKKKGKRRQGGKPAQNPSGSSSKSGGSSWRRVGS